MGLIKEPLGVDFVVDGRPLTKEEAQAISAFIRTDKAKVKKLQKKFKKSFTKEATISVKNPTTQKRKSQITKKKRTPVHPKPPSAPK